MHFVKDVKYLSEYKLLLTFEDGSLRQVDLAPHLDGEVFEPLKELSNFRSVHLSELLRGLVEPTRKESGCVSYELLQNREDPTDFTFVEEWESDTAFESHADSDHIKAIGPKLQPVVADAPDIRTYLAVN